MSSERMREGGAKKDPVPEQDVFVILYVSNLETQRSFASLG